MNRGRWPTAQAVQIKLLPRDVRIGRGDTVLTTVLGSCVSACLWDATAGIAGMNHFMLPAMPANSSARPDRSEDTGYGQRAMDRLIADLIAAGARREHLEAKVFGGAKVLTDMRIARIGDANAEFVRQYLATAGIKIQAADLGGNQARQLQYDCRTGRARVRRLAAVNNDLDVIEQRLANWVAHRSAVVEMVS